jgi:hypothetical protein
MKEKKPEEHVIEVGTALPFIIGDVRFWSFVFNNSDQGNALEIVDALVRVLEGKKFADAMAAIFIIMAMSIGCVTYPGKEGEEK